MKVVKKSQSAFSLIEISVVILIIGILVAGIFVADSLVKKSRIAAAQSLSRSSPINAIPDSALWLESSLDSSFVSGEDNDNTTLSTWNDQRNSSTKVAISKVGAGPVYSNTINRVHAVKFDGSDTNYLRIDDAKFLNGTDYTIFFLEKRQSNKSNNYFFGDSSITTANQNLFLGYGADGEIVHSQGSNTYSSFVSNYASSTNNSRLFTFVQSAQSGKKTYVNGVLAAQSSDTTQLSNISTLAIGKGYQGEIGEIAIFTRALKDEERKSVEDYMGLKWSNKINRAETSSCIGGTITSSGCTPNCTVTLAGTLVTQVADGTGSVSCNDTNYSGSVTYSCSGGSFTPSGSCGCATGYTGSGCSSCDTAAGYLASGGSCILAPSPCTGGTIDTTTVPGATIHKFTTSGSFQCPSSRNVEVLVVGGGGGGINIGGGGGGGGVVYKSSHAVTTSSYSVTVGNGGSVGANGQNSVFDSITAYGGGGGGSNHANGLSGGSGGGAGRDYTGTGGAATKGVGGTLYGNVGGNGATTIWSGGAGGGGAGGAGGNSLGGSSSTERGGAGGAALSHSISGVAVDYAGGGGGGNEGNANVALGGGTNSGGNGGSTSTNAVAGFANTGGGGGGTRNGGTGAVGGSGVVIIRY